MLGWTLILQEVIFATTTKKRKNILNINYICRKVTSLTQTHLWTINNAKPTNTHYFKSSDGGAIFTVEILPYTSFQFNVFDMFSRLGFCLSAPSCARSLPFVYSFWSAQDVFPVWGMDCILKWINKCVYNVCGQVTTIELQSLEPHMNTRIPKTQIWLLHKLFGIHTNQMAQCVAPPKNNNNNNYKCTRTSGICSFKATCSRAFLRSLIG